MDVDSIPEQERVQMRMKLARRSFTGRRWRSAKDQSDYYELVAASYREHAFLLTQREEEAQKQKSLRQPDLSQPSLQQPDLTQPERDPGECPKCHSNNSVESTDELHLCVSCTWSWREKDGGSCE